MHNVALISLNLIYSPQEEETLSSSDTIQLAVWINLKYLRCMGIPRSGGLSWSPYSHVYISYSYCNLHRRHF